MGAAIARHGQLRGNRAGRLGVRIAARFGARLAVAIVPALAAIAGCGGTVTVEGPGSGEGRATTTSTATGWGGATTSTSSTTTTATDCDADLSVVLGASAACNECSRAHCCPEAEAFAAHPTADTYDSLVACGAGSDEAPCAEPCVTSLCDSDLGYVYQQACADCLNTWCCGPFDACLADAPCATGCLYDFSQDCCSLPRFVTWDECASSSCSDVCVTGWCAG